MLVSDIMTSNPAVCGPDDKVRSIAELMVRHDCGAIPICDGPDTRRVLGIVTDRDIACRVVAAGKDPDQATATDCMSHPVATVNQEAALEDCCRILEENQVRRAVVLDSSGRCCGMVSQADIARHAPLQETGEVVKEVSRAS